MTPPFSALGVIASGHTGTLFADDFNRPNGAIGPDWLNSNGVSAGSLLVVSNAVSAPDVSTHFNKTVVTSPSPDMWAQATIATPGGSTSLGVGCRIQALAETGYVVRGNVSQFNLFRVSGGTYTSIGSYVTAPVAGDVLRLETQGSSIRAYVNGVLRISVTDATHTTGDRGALRIQGTAARMDNFSMGKL